MPSLAFEQPIAPPPPRAVREPATPSRRTRALVALLLAGAAAGLLGAQNVLRPEWRTDFDQLWFAARALLQGHDPYAAIAAERARFAWPLYYPLPAVLLAAPLSILPLGVARMAFQALGVGACAYVLTARAWWPLWLFACPATVLNVLLNQWSPHLIAAAFVPALGFVAVAKPNTGLALGTIRPTRTAAVSALVLVAASFLVRPGWLAAWLAAITDSDGIHAPLVLPWGWLLLLALLRWRRREARLLLALAALPQTVHFAQSLPLLLTAGSRRDLLVLGATLGIALILGPTAPTNATWGQMMQAAWPYILVGGYLPAVILLLRRPNVDEASPWWPVPSR